MSVNSSMFKFPYFPYKEISSSNALRSLVLISVYVTCACKCHMSCLEVL